MNGPAFRLALQHSVRSVVLISLALGLFYWVTLLSSSAFLSPDQQLPPFLTEPPRVMRAFLGGSANFISPTAWLASGMLHPIVLSLTSIAAFIVVTGTGATELERGTLDLVLSRPLTRRSYLLGRAAAGLIMLALAIAGGFVGTLISREIVSGVDELPIGRTAIVFGAQYLLFSAFALIALAISVRSNLRSRALGASIGVVVGAFFVNFLSLLFDALAWLGYITPFHYFNVANIIEGGPYLGHIAVLAGVAAGAGLLALRTFQVRDLSR